MVGVYEYLVKVTEDILNGEKLNGLGLARWELVSAQYIPVTSVVATKVLFAEGSYVWVYYFKRTTYETKRNKFSL